MKKYILHPFLLCLIASFVQAQSGKLLINTGVNIKADQVEMRIYEGANSDTSTEMSKCFLKMKYGTYDILNPEAMEHVVKGSNTIIGVDLLYTDYQNQDEQNILNKRRINELYFLYPDLFKQTMVNWRFVKQVGFADELGAKKLPHGFVITYHTSPSYTISDLKTQLEKISVHTVPDTSLFKHFRKHINSSDDLICVDMTGSMSPYYKQLFLWITLKGNTKDTLKYALFNDGDLKPDHYKKAMNTGGIYSFKSNHQDTTAKYLLTCIAGGGGGDSPENNIEAAMNGLKKFPKTKEIIMLVDNWADMRDYSYIGDLTKPVRVIICGSQIGTAKYPINPQYLDLAKRTKGSICTIEEELTDLSKVNEGTEITLGGTKYLFSGGRFLRK